MQNSVEQLADEILVIDAQSGSGRALETLVSRWQKRLWCHAFNLTNRHTEAAWDVTQEAWLDIVRGLGRLKEPARFGSWAYRIVSHKAYDWRRRNGREVPVETDSEPVEFAIGEEPTLGEASDIHDVLQRLTNRSQVVLNLHYLAGFGLDEIADILGLPPGTIKSRLHAARIEFRKHWERSGNVPCRPAPASEKK